MLYLKRTLSQKDDELADMLEKLQDLQAAKDAEKEFFDRQLSALQSEFQETRDKLTSENMVLGKNIQTNKQNTNSPFIHAKYVFFIAQIR